MKPIAFEGYYKFPKKGFRGDSPERAASELVNKLQQEKIPAKSLAGDEFRKQFLLDKPALCADLADQDYVVITGKDVKACYPDSEVSESDDEAKTAQLYSRVVDGAMPLASEGWWYDSRDDYEL